MTPNEGTIEEEPGRGGNERTRLLTTARTTIKTPPGDHDRDGDGQYGEGICICVCDGGWQASGVCSAEMVENDNDAETGTNVGAVEG